MSRWQKISIASLGKRLEAVVTQLKKQHEPQREVIFETYWGGEEIVDDGSPVFVTDWGGGPLDDDNEGDELS